MDNDERKSLDNYNEQEIIFSPDEVVEYIQSKDKNTQEKNEDEINQISADEKDKAYLNNKAFENTEEISTELPINFEDGEVEITSNFSELPRRKVGMRKSLKKISENDEEAQIILKNSHEKQYADGYSQSSPNKMQEESNKEELSKLDCPPLDSEKVNMLFMLLTDPKVLKGLRLLGGFAEYLEINGKDILNLKK